MIAAKDGDLIEQPFHLPAGQALDGRFFLGQAGQGGLGLVERPQRLRRGFPGRRQYGDLQILHRFRLASTGSNTSSWTKAGINRAICSRSIPTSTWRPLLAYAKAKERRHHPLDDLEDAGGPVRQGHGPVQPLGRRRPEGRFHAAGRPMDGQLLLQGRGRGGPAAISSSISTAPTNRRACTGPSPTSSPARASRASRTVQVEPRRDARA